MLLSLQSLQPSPQASRVGSWETSLAAARRAAEGGGKRKTGKESVGPAVGVTEGGRGGRPAKVSRWGEDARSKWADQVWAEEGGIKISAYDLTTFQGDTEGRELPPGQWIH